MLSTSGKMLIPVDPTKLFEQALGMLTARQGMVPPPSFLHSIVSPRVQAEPKRGRASLPGLARLFGGALPRVGEWPKLLPGGMLVWRSTPPRERAHAPPRAGGDVGQGATERPSTFRR